MPLTETALPLAPRAGLLAVPRTHRGQCLPWRGRGWGTGPGGEKGLENGSWRREEIGEQVLEEGKGLENGSWRREGVGNRSWRR